MRKSKIILVGAIVFFVSASLSSCKKYEEGPTLSLRSKSTRVTNEWKVKYAYDTKDLEVVTNKYTNETWTFTKDNEWIERENGIIDKSGTWEFLNDKQSLIITTDLTDHKYFDILKLKENEMWLNGEEKELHLISVDN